MQLLMASEVQSNLDQRRSLMLRAMKALTFFYALFMLFPYSLLYHLPFDCSFSDVDSLTHWSDLMPIIALFIVLVKALQGCGSNAAHYAIWSAASFVLLICNTHLHSDAGILAVSLWLIFFGSILFQKRDRSRALLFLQIVLVAQLLVASIAFIKHYHQFHSPVVGFRVSGLYTNPEIIYPVLLSSLFLFRSIWRCSEKGYKQQYAIAMTVLSFILLWYTYTRAAWLGLIVGVVITEWNSNRLKRAALLVLSLLTFAAILFVRTAGKPITLKDDKSTLSRVEILKHVIPAIKAHLLFGQGYNSYHLILSHLQNRLHRYHLGYLPDTPHNLYVDLLLDTGVVGTVIFCIFSLAMFRYAYRCLGAPELPGTGRILVLTLIGSFASLLAAGLVDSTLFRLSESGPGTACILLLAGTVCSMGNPEGSATRNNSSTP